MIRRRIARFLAWLREPLNEPPPQPEDLSPLHRRVRKPKDNSHLKTKEDYAEYFNQVSRRPVNHTITFQRYYIVKRFRPAPGDTILDFGCYIGNNLLRYAIEGHQIDGIEVGKAYIETFSNRPETRALDEATLGRIRIFTRLIEDFQPDRRYDWVLCAELLEHVMDPVIILQKAHECLEPGGKIFIAVPLEARRRTDVRDVGRPDMDGWLKEAKFFRWDFDEIYPERLEGGGKEWGVAQLLCIAQKQPETRPELSH